MLLAITERYGKAEDGTEEYSIGKKYEEMLKKMNVELYPIKTEAEIEKAVKKCDGLVITGSSIDVDPRNYNEKPITEIGEENAELDKFDFAIIKAFNNENKPILGICRGTQAINVCFGGSLYQDIPNHKLDTNKRHIVKIAKDSTLYDCYQKEEIPVNSLHHQAIKKIAEGFKPIAISEDGIVEGIENENIIGVQWHPEMMEDIKFFESAINKMKKVIKVN